MEAKHDMAMQIESLEVRTAAKSILDIAQVTIDFSTIKRAPRYCVGYAENNAEHSFMLGLAAMEIGTQHFPSLDNGLTVRLALVHDLVELKTGDTPTFAITDAELHRKHEAEQAALLSLQDELPVEIGNMLTLYERQDIPEARLVRHIDKLLPFAVDIQGDGLGVMQDVFGISSASQFIDNAEQLDQRYKVMFPEPNHQVLHDVHNVLATKFGLKFPES